MKKFEGFLKGVNLGGWISQFAKYDEEHFNTFITEKDLEYIASLGFDHVRVPVDYTILEDEEGNLKSTAFNHLDDCLNWCKKYNLNMVIDLHEIYGYSFDPSIVNNDRRKFFYDDALQERFFKLWDAIANHYKNDQGMLAFEPLNEVVLAEVCDAWNEIVSKYVRMIRKITPDVYIIVGGVCYNSVSSVPLLKVPVDDKIVYNFHCYDPHIFTHQGAYWEPVMPRDFRIGYPESLEVYRKESGILYKEFTGPLFMEDLTEVGVEFFEKIFEPAIETAERDNVSLYCGEYGVIDLADNHDKIKWLSDIHTAFSKCGIGRALWNYKEKDFGFVDESFAEVKDDFIAVL